jgi:hypothetical protein
VLAVTRSSADECAPVLQRAVFVVAAAATTELGTGTTRKRSRGRGAEHGGTTTVSWSQERH